jgi:FkbM family methyltransferase
MSNVVIKYLKPLIQRFPILELSYRTVRDHLEAARQKPVVTPYGFKLMGNTSMQNGTFEPMEVEVLKKYFEDADTFIDIGANIGFYTCMALSLNKYAIAFEPLEQNLRYLYRNLIENGWNRIEVFPLGLSNKLGFASLYGTNTGASLISGWANSSPLLKCTIPLSTLDTVLDKRLIGHRLVIKIDVEGTEQSVLEGAKNHLQLAPRPTWLVEINLTEHHPAGVNPNFIKTFETFWYNGYEAHTVDQNSKVVTEVDVKRWFLNRYRDFGSQNYLFTEKA